MAIKVIFEGWEEDPNSEYKLFWLGEDKSVHSLLHTGPIPEGFTLTLRERGFYRLAGIGLHVLGYTGLDITPEMFDAEEPLVLQAKPELFDLVPKSHTRSSSD